MGALRSLLALVLVGIWFAIPGSPWLRLYVVPMAWLHPDRRVRLASTYMKAICHGILGLFELVGGARFTRVGRLPTQSPILILMNHQSLLDICTVAVMASGDVPAFVTRARYSRFVPLVSTTARLLDSPFVEPRRDPRAALRSIETTAREQERSLLIFPEGHRSSDGQPRPFKPGGVQAALRGRRMPVYLVVTDGFWAGRRLLDFIFNVHRLRGLSEVYGPFEPPADDADVPAFVQQMHGRVAERLAELRRDAVA